MQWRSTGPCKAAEIGKDVQLRNSWFCNKAKALAQLRNTTVFADLVLVSEDRIEFPVHTDIVCAASDYFDRIIRHDAQESGDKLPKLSIHGITGVILKAVLDFLYSGELMLSIDTVADMFRAGDFIAVSEITETCLSWLLNAFEDKKKCAKAGNILFSLQQQYEYPQLTTLLNQTLSRHAFTLYGIFGRLGSEYFIEHFRTHYLVKSSHVIMGSSFKKKISKLFKLCFPKEELNLGDRLFLDRPTHLYISELCCARHPVPGPGYLLSNKFKYSCAKFPPQDWAISKLIFSTAPSTGCLGSIKVEYRNIWTSEVETYLSKSAGPYFLNSGAIVCELQKQETICGLDIYAGWMLNIVEGVTTSSGRTLGPFGRCVGGAHHLISLSQPTLPFEVSPDLSDEADNLPTGSGCSNPCLYLHGVAFQEIITSNSYHCINIRFIFAGLAPGQTCEFPVLL